jgi:homogentisate 1,2-dioxygenase
VSRRWISLPRTEGRVSRQAHVDLPEGTFERELGREGFFGPATHMYHQHPPTSWSACEGPLRPRAFDTSARPGEVGCPWDAPGLLRNERVALRVLTLAASMDALVRNADGDELLFVHRGEGSLFCDYGHLAFRDGDYLLIPRGTLWRIEVAQPVTLLAIEATGSAFQLPERGLLGDHAVFDPGILDAPRLDEPFEQQRERAREWQVRVKARGAVSTLTYPHNPLDAVGWKGNLSVLRLNWRDIRPVVSARYHLPPSAHTTFVADRFVVCTFCPRPIETDPGALKLPFFHSNDDYDEVIFYHAGDFTSRDSIGPGMLTLHPCGVTHGPHPKALRKSQESPRRETDEVAVMIDTRDPLEVSAAAEAVEWSGYVDSWREPLP